MSITNSPDAGISCAVTVQNGQAVTSSLKVAEIFGKNHKNVIRAIQKIIAEYPQNSGQLIFEPTEYKWTNNLGMIVRSPMYLMNRDGFTLLAFSFTGKKAMQFKVAYINRFNEMESKLNGGMCVSPHIGNHVYGAIEKLTSAVDRLTAAIHTQQQSKPTFYEVREFCRKNNLFKVNPLKFFRYYARQNWMESGLPIDWKNACFSWHNFYLSNIYK